MSLSRWQTDSETRMAKVVASVLAGAATLCGTAPRAVIVFSLKEGSAVLDRVRKYAPAQPAHLCAWLSAAVLSLKTIGSACKLLPHSLVTHPNESILVLPDGERDEQAERRSAYPAENV